MDEVNSELVCSSVLRPLVHDIRCLLVHNLTLKIKYGVREANMVVHGPAKFALSLYGENIWMEDCPSSIMPLVIKKKSCN